MTRNGKIARLPWHIRNTLNRRLLDGEPGRPLLDWLNAQPQVVEVLKTYFGGVPINAQSLSEWRQGGYKDWLRHKEACDEIERLSEQSCELGDAASDASVIEMAARMMAVEFARNMKEVMAEATDPKQRWRALQELLPLLAQFRRAEHRAVKIEMDQEKWQWERDRLDKEKAEEEMSEAKQRVLAPIMDQMRRGTLVEAFGGGKTGAEIADFVIKLQNIKLPDPDGPRREDGDEQEEEIEGENAPSPQPSPPMGAREIENEDEDGEGEEVQSPLSKVQSRENEAEADGAPGERRPTRKHTGATRRRADTSARQTSGDPSTPGSFDAASETGGNQGESD